MWIWVGRKIQMSARTWLIPSQSTSSTPMISRVSDSERESIPTISTRHPSLSPRTFGKIRRRPNLTLRAIEKVHTISINTWLQARRLRKNKKQHHTPTILRLKDTSLATRCSFPSFRCLIQTRRETCEVQYWWHICRQGITYPRMGRPSRRFSS